MPGGFRLSGKDAFAAEAANPAFAGLPDITVTRMIEADDVVVAEGSVRARTSDGRPFAAVFCDVFEMERGRIRRLVSYVVPVAAGEGGAEVEPA
jgi:ketosteroid isomerase-like protein